MRFLVDANLSPRVAEWLRGNGHDAAHVFDLGLHEAGDPRIFDEAVGRGQIVLTSDLDFGEVLARSSGRVSVMILRLRAVLPPASPSGSREPFRRLHRRWNAAPR